MEATQEAALQDVDYESSWPIAINVAHEAAGEAADRKAVWALERFVLELPRKTRHSLYKL